MWKSKKFIIISIVVAVVVLVGASVGVAFAADNPPAQTQTAPAGQDQLLARVAKILGIDQAKVESAFKQAQKELADQRFDQYLKKLVTDGKLTQQQADQYKQWIQSRPNIDLPGGGHGGFFNGPIQKQGILRNAPATNS
ncbi:MAG: hypothetical protein A2Z02_02560 [Chloroflexi bacterium RBG_16_48_7]|nr:MAG: hypothetical protein A2Z02_02560 [Chloroflexi bacterium RBG_16_48_7]